MKRLSILLILLIMGGSAFARRGGPFGLGIIIGEPTGISGKLWLTRTTALDGAIGWSWGHRLHMHFDYLWHNFHLIRVERGQLPLYLGIGGRLSIHEKPKGEGEVYLGIRGAVGLEYLFATVPIDIFAEIALVMDIVPATRPDVEGGLGARFFF